MIGQIHDLDLPHSSCYVIDNAGYIIAHKDFKSSGDDVTDVGHVHITHKEPEASYWLYENDVMLKDGCMSYEKSQIQTFWKVRCLVGFQITDY